MKPVRVATSWSDGQYSLVETSHLPKYSLQRDTWTLVPWWQWKLYRLYLWVNGFAVRFESRVDRRAWEERDARTGEPHSHY